MRNALYDWFGLNTWAMLKVNELHWPALDSVMLAATTLSHPNLYPVYLAIALWGSWRAPRVLPLRSVLAFALAFPMVSIVVVPWLKSLFDYARPVAVLGEPTIRTLVESDPVHSFPSGHAAFATLIAASFVPGARRSIRVALIGFATLACYSRVYSGAHFPADVAAGALLALTIGWIVRRALSGGHNR